MARLYADENFDYPVVLELRRLGHDVLTAQEAGQANRQIPDTVVLPFATALGRAVLTLNRRHYIALHLASPWHAGIIVCTRALDGAALAPRIAQAIAATASLLSQLLRVIRPPTP